VEEPLRDAGELGRAVVNLVEGEPEAARKTEAEARLIDEARRLAVLVDERSVKRRPAPVGPLHDVADEHMGVELRVARPRGAVAKARRHEAARSDPLAPVVAAPSEGGVGLQVGERLGDGVVVRPSDGVAQVIGTEAVEDAHRLRRREGDVEAGDPIGPKPPDERLAVGGRPAGEEGTERFRLDVSREPELGAGPADPATGRLAGADVVLLQPCRDAS